MRNYLIILLLLSLSCSDKKSLKYLKNDNLFVVDLDKGEKVDTFLSSYLFKSVKCIPLETNDEVLVGDVDKVLVYQNNIYVLDCVDAKGLFVFDKEGRFIRKIGRMGGGPGEYTAIYDFTIDTDNNKIILFDGLRLLFFNASNGQFERTIVIKNSATMSVAQYVNNMLYTDLHEFGPNKTTFMLQSINLSNGEIIGKFLDATIYNKGWNELVSFDEKCIINTLDSPYLFRQLFMDTIFSLTPQGISPYLVIESKDFVSDKDLEKPFEEDPQYYFRLDDKDKIYRIFNYIITSDLIYFQFHKGRKGFSGTYNLTSKKTHIFEITINDLLYTEGPYHTFKYVFYDNSGVYECINNGRSLSRILYAFQEDRILSDDVKNKLGNLPEDTNPVILYYEFK